MQMKLFLVLFFIFCSSYTFAQKKVPVEFPGGIKAFNCFVSSHFDHKIYENCPDCSKTLFGVKIDSTGRGHAVVENNLVPELEEEWQRVVSLMPEWISVTETPIPEKTIMFGCMPWNFKCPQMTE